MINKQSSQVVKQVQQILIWVTWVLSLMHLLYTVRYAQCVYLRSCFVNQLSASALTRHQIQNTVFPLWVGTSGHGILWLSVRWRPSAAGRSWWPGSTRGHFCPHSPLLSYPYKEEEAGRCVELWPGIGYCQMTHLLEYHYTVCSQWVIRRAATGADGVFTHLFSLLSPFFTEVLFKIEE